MIFPDELIKGDCLEVMKDIPDKSIDMIRRVNTVITLISVIPSLFY